MLCSRSSTVQRSAAACVRHASSSTSAQSATASASTQTSGVATKPVHGPLYRAPLFTQTVVLSDGATFTRLTTSPRASVRLTRDVRNNPLWNPSAAAAAIGEETGRLARFRDRFAGFDAPSPASQSAAAKGAKSQEEEDNQLDWLVDASAKAAPKISEREAREASRGNKPAKKK